MFSQFICPNVKKKKEKKMSKKNFYSNSNIQSFHTIVLVFILSAFQFSIDNGVLCPPIFIINKTNVCE